MTQSALTTPFQADTESELPVGVQLAWRLRALITAGRVAAGERMPSVRTMAEWADVNVNTVRAVYARLEREGLIETRHGLGSYVAANLHGSTEVEQIAAEAIAAAHKAGVDPRDVAITALVSAALPDAAELPVPADDGPGALDLAELATELDLDDAWLEVDEGAARRELRRQIGRIEAELASYSRDIEPPSTPPLLNPNEPRVAGVAALAQTRDALLAQLAEARGSAIRRARRERRAREVRDAIVADPAGHRWEVVSATDTGEEGCTTWRVGPRMGPLGALMNWWRVKVSGGCPLPPPLAAATEQRPGRTKLLPGIADGSGGG
jgi:DNA-binding transcriptional regulator YhcF (GntR family)